MATTTRKTPAKKATKKRADDATTLEYLQQAIEITLASTRAPTSSPASTARWAA